MKRMKRNVRYPFGLTLLVLAVLAAIPAAAQTVANGPYYATPSWDQTLPASTRFIVLSNFDNQAVLDRETGLVWQRSPQNLNALWGFAVVRCVQQTTVGNRKGWRLPTVEELASLVDPSVPSPGPTLPAGHPFQNVQSVLHWSASTVVNAPTSAWNVDFGAGEVVSSFKTTTGASVWCVRGGQGVDTHLLQ
jgi:hypothetical protein